MYKVKKALNLGKKGMLLLWLIYPALLIGQIEICDNGIDDDGDLLVDLNDDDCPCDIIEPISLIPNPSFEDMDCCPYDRSQLDCASLWIQASEPTTDFIHTCDWLGWDDFPPPMPFPDGQGIMGFRDGRVRGNGGPDPYWKEYAGACLIRPLEKGKSYRFQFDVGFVDQYKSPPIDVTFFGTGDCRFLPFGQGNEAFGCPTNGPDWIKLGAVSVSGGKGNRWVNTFLEIIPEEDIFAIAIGPACAPTVSEVSTYYFFDNLLLADLNSFNLQIKQEHHPCHDSDVLSVPHNNSFQYQWYKAGVALIGEIHSTLQHNYGSGSYQVRIFDGQDCRISASFELEIPVIHSSPTVSICSGEAYVFREQFITEAGFYTDTLQTPDGCDSLVTLEVVVIGARYDTLDIQIPKGTSLHYEGQQFSDEADYPLVLTSSLGCDSLVLLRLTHFEVHLPNVFSPNGDGQNDVFAPFLPNDQVLSYEFLIYDRWGNLMHRGADWDGRSAGSGVYTYLLNMQFEHGITAQYFGSVTVIK